MVNLKKSQKSLKHGEIKNGKRNLESLLLRQAKDIYQKKQSRA